MDIKVKVFLIIIALFMIGSCSKITSPLETKKELTLSRELTSDEKSLIEADKNFGLKLFQSVNASDSNVLLEPQIRN